ncbi:pentapeptide repeat-containing protein [Rhodonellum ikkaensis]
MDCIFTNCNFSLCKLPHCQMNNVSFKDCKILGVNFSKCLDFLFEVKFEDCSLDYCSFTRKKLPKTQFIKCSMRHVDFFESDLSKSSFSETDLTNAIFNNTILKEVDFTTASNYSIDPERNTIKKAKFSLLGIEGLLHKYDIKIE